MDCQITPLFSTGICDKVDTNRASLPLFLVSQSWLYLGNSQVSVYRTIDPLVLKIGQDYFLFFGGSSKIH